MGKTRKQPALSLLVGGSAALLLLLAWIAVAIVLSLQWREAAEAEQRQNRNLGSALGEQTLRVLAAVDQATVRLRDDLIAEPGQQPDLVRIANETGLAPQILVQLSLIDATGHFIGSNLDPEAGKAGRVDLSQREHVSVHLASREAQDTGLFIGKPVLGKVSQRWSIQLSRKISSRQGQTLGVVVASLDPGYFEQVYRSVAMGQEGGVTLLGEDLVVRARVIGGEPLGMGSKLADGSAFERRTPKPVGQYQASSALDGVERFFAYRRVADYPLYIVVSSSVDEAMSAWRSMRNAMLWLAGLLTLVVATAAVLIVDGLRRLEQRNAALRLSEAEAQSANQAKTEFLAAMSHELRTPLTSIRGYAELMENRLSDERYRLQAGLIRKGAEHLNALLTEILDFAKIEAGAVELVSESLALPPLLQGTADFFALSAGEKQLELQLDMSDSLPTQIVGDSMRLKQILNNLLSNAIKFTASGSITLRAWADAGTLWVEVEDTGPGIAPELHELVFERFRQGDAKVSYQHGGTGLGLALSRGLAERMGGRLSLRSAPGQGACFTLELPLTMV